MKRLIVCLSVLSALVPIAQGQFTMDLTIEATGTLTEPTGPDSLGKFAILDFTIDGTGLLSLNHDFSNSANTLAKAWGDALDFSGASGISSAVPGSFGIRIYGVNPTGADQRIYSMSDKGMGVGGLNSGRMDWGTANAASESIRVEVNATGLPTTMQLVITGLQFGNGNAIGEVQPEALIGSLVNITGFTGSLGPMAPATDGIDFVIPNGGFSFVGGGGEPATGSFTLSQGTQPAAGDGPIGFSLQGITFDVVPVTPVPEPSALAFLFAIGAIGFVFWRRR